MDMPAVESLLWAFFEESSVRELAQPDESYCRQLLREIAASDGVRGFLLVAERDGQIVGAACATGPAFWFSPQTPFLVEMFIYVLPDHRNGVGRQLTKALEFWSKFGGHNGLILRSGAGDPRAGKLFTRMSYVPMEQTHMKHFKEAAWPQ